MVIWTVEILQLLRSLKSGERERMEEEGDA